jgi:hypothetical protein
MVALLSSKRLYSSVGGAEVDDLLAVRVLAQCRDDQVGLLGLQVGDAVGARHRHQLGLDTQLGGDQLGHRDVQTLRLHVGADETIGRVVGGHGDLDRLALGDRVQRGLGVGAHGGQPQEASGQREQQAAGERRGHSRAPR